MSSERALPFAPKPPEGWDDHVEVMRATRMFLLQKKGPTRFVVRGESSDRKFTVLVGNRARCTCGISLCLHHLFVMLKVLKVPPSNPLAWQTALIDSEVDCILDGGSFGRNKERGQRGDGAGAPPGQRREFLRRGAGRTSAGGAGGSGSSRGAGGAAGVDGGGTGEGGGTRRLDIVPGEVCPVCQEEMEEDGGGGETWADGGDAAPAAAEGRLTYCRDGCGNNMHTRCMLMYAEHRRSSGDKPCCPLCRVDWSLAAVRALREDSRRQAQENGGGKRRGGAAAANSATSARAPAVAPVTCRSCSIKVQAAFFRCLVCTPPGSWDLCRRCYAMSGARRSSRRGGSGTVGPCVSVGRHRHPFVQGEAAADPPEWTAAEPPDGDRRAAGTGGGSLVGRAGSAAAGVLSLQGREITTADFELLLTLDASAVAPLHEHLLHALPRCDGKADGHAGGLVSPSALNPRPSVGIERIESGSSGDAENVGSSEPQSSEVLPPTSSALPSQPGQRAVEVASLMPPPASSSASTAPPPSLGELVAAAAVARNAAAGAAEAAEAAEAAGGEGAVLDGEEAAGEEGVVQRPVEADGGVAVASTAAPWLPLDELAPISGSFTSGNMSCCCCSRVEAAFADTARGTGHTSNHPSRTPGPPAVGRQSPPPSLSPSPPVSSSQTLFRQLPCGHTAHEACLIPLILESVGKGDPSCCRCPLDSAPIFPALSRHRRRVRRRRPGSDDGGAAAAAASAAAAAVSHKHRRGTRSASSVPPAPANGGIDRHARAAATRELLRRNIAAGFGGGGANAADLLGITLFGSGLAQQPPLPPPPPPPPPTAMNAASSAALRPREIETAKSSSSPDLVVGGEGIAGAAGAEVGGVRTAGRPQRPRHLNGSTCVVRGSTVGGRLGRRRGLGTGRDRNAGEACGSVGRAADSVEGLALTTLPLASSKEAAARGQSFSREGGARGSGVRRRRNRLAVVVRSPSTNVGALDEALDTLAVGGTAAGEGPPG